MHDGRISIIIPVLDEVAQLTENLDALQDLRQRGHEVLVVDGGSRDGSVTVARRLADRVLMSGPGLAQRKNAGAASASHEILLFLHADTRLPEGADSLIRAAIDMPGQIWGRFDLRLASSAFAARMLGSFISWRASITGLVNDSQALFVERTWFERVGGYTDDERALSRKLKRHGWPARITAPVRSRKP